MTIVTDLIIKEILQEVSRAQEKHPDWPDDIIHAAAIVGEESGELIRASLNHVYEDGNILDVEKEAVQTAATSIRFLLALKQKKFNQ